MNIGTFIRLASNKVINHTQWYDRYWGGVIKFWHTNQFNLDCVNLGSNSGLYGFDYTQIEGVQGANWALGPQSLVHDFNIFKSSLSYLKEGGTVFIPICPFSCLISRYNKESNLKYYTILHPATIIDFEDSERTKALSIMHYPFKAMPLYCIKQLMKDVIRKAIPSRKKKIDFVVDSNRVLTSWQKQFGITDLNASLSSQHAEEQIIRAATLHEMICFCRERKLKPVVVLLPMHPALVRQLSDSFRQHYIYDFIQKADIGDTPFIDGFEEKNYLNTDFRSSYLLNKQGAMKFTDQLCKRLSIGQENCF